MSHTRMKKFRLNIAIICLATAALITAALLHAQTSRGQSRKSAKPVADARVKQVLRASGEPASPAARNAQLSHSLTWTFGSKRQRGWQLYKPLIGRLLDTKHDVA